MCTLATAPRLLYLRSSGPGKRKWSVLIVEFPFSYQWLLLNFEIFFAIYFVLVSLPSLFSAILHCPTVVYVLIFVGNWSLTLGIYVSSALIFHWFLCIFQLLFPYITLYLLHLDATCAMLLANVLSASMGHTCVHPWVIFAMS